MLAMRVNYVGELGWELHVPMEQMVPIYDALWEAGKAFDIRDFGMYAMDSLRLEKVYRGWKSDMTHEYTPLMASLDRFVDFQKPAFRGLEALVKERSKGPKERFVPLVARRRQGLRRAGLRAGLSRRGAGGAGRPPAATATPSARASRSPMCAPISPTSARRWRSRCSATGARRSVSQEPDLLRSGQCAVARP